MKVLVFIICILLFYSCSEEKREQSVVKDKVNEVDSVNTKDVEVHFSTTAEYTDIHECAFSIKIPADFSLRKMYEDESADYCDFDVETGNEDLKFEIHSLLKSRAETSDLKELFENSIHNFSYKVNGHGLHENGYFISAHEDKTDKEVYFLRRIGDNFISDVLIIYPKKYQEQVEMYLAVLFVSFESD
jgi:hypothetical protein